MVRPSLTDRVGDQPTGVRQGAQGKVGRLGGVGRGASLGQGVSTFIALDARVRRDPDEANRMADISEGVESIDGIPDRAARGAPGIKCSKGRPGVAKNLHVTWAKGASFPEDMANRQEDSHHLRLKHRRV